MRRPLCMGVCCALVLAGSFAAGGKVVTVTNPMTEPLQGAGYDALDLGHVVAQRTLTVGDGIVYLDLNHNRPSLRTGADDPRTSAVTADAAPSSIYVQFAAGVTSPLWVKTGPFPSDWQQVALVPSQP